MVTFVHVKVLHHENSLVSNYLLNTANKANQFDLNGCHNHLLSV